MKALLILTSFAFLALSCVKDKTVEPAPEPVDPCAETVSFNDELLPEIFNISCNTSGCHDAVTGSGGYVLETHEQICTNADVILDVLQHNSGFVPMPLGGEKLNDSLIQKMDCWIEQGLLNN